MALSPKLQEDTLRSALEPVQDRGRRLFAAACATRGQAGYWLYAREAGGNGQSTVKGSLDFVWRHIVVTASPQQFLYHCDLLLDQTDALWEAHLDWAQPSLLAVHAALRALDTPTVAVAIAPATYDLEILDHWVTTQLNLDLHDRENEELLRKHPAMLREIERQERDLRDITIQDRRGDAAWDSFVQDVRTRSEAEANDFLS